MKTIAADLGGTKIAAAVVDAMGRIESRRSVPTPAAEGSEAILNAVSGVIGSLLTAELREQLAGVAVASAGVIDLESGAVTSATDILAGWAGTPVAAALRDRLSLPVVVLNDVHAHALGEACRGAGVGHGSVLLVAAGTGLGGGFVSGGMILTGEHHAAGHLGHVPCEEASGLICSCGVEGHLECIASGGGLVTAAGRRYPTAALISQAASEGDSFARDLVGRSGTALGRAIGGWANLLDPGLVVVTGGLADAGELWWGPLQEAAAAEALPVARPLIVPSSLGADAALVGAAEYARSIWRW